MALIVPMLDLDLEISAEISGGLVSAASSEGEAELRCPKVGVEAGVEATSSGGVKI